MWMAYLWPAVMLAGSGVFAWIQIRDLLVYAREKAPTKYRAEELANYRGERWLAVTGKLRFDLASRNFDNSTAVASGKRLLVHVPMSSAAAPAGEPLRVVWTCSSANDGEYQQWKAANEELPEQTVTGLRRPIGNLRYAALFPGVLFEDAISLHEGQQPHPPGPTFFMLALSSIMCLVSARRLMKLLSS
jgi:hypothetical protein